MHRSGQKRHILALLLAILMLVSSALFAFADSAITEPAATPKETKAESEPKPTGKAADPTPKAEENAPDPTKKATESPPETPTTVSSGDPTATPGDRPSPSPSGDPTEQPGDSPSPSPSGDPTEQPGDSPSPSPSGDPTEQPGDSPSPSPSGDPTEQPGESPSPDPSMDPDASPSPSPSEAPGDAEATPNPGDKDDSDGSEDRSVNSEGSGLGMAYGEPIDSLDWSDGVPLGEGDMPVPRLFQYNFNNKLCTYNGKARSVHTSGCNVTCISMVVAYLTGNTDQSPETMFAWAVKKGLYRGDGLGHTQMSKVASHFGVSGRWIGKDKKAILKALDQGKPVIAHMGPGTFTNRGHYIVLRGVDENGKIRVNDPMSKSRSNKTYSLDKIIKESRTSNPFMICTPS
ncbi:C39 family peptidase [Eubacteriales bacterium OttesenSCG-928-N13]|nr:C39 family peptidase [Eubacteriales bacterium OttesenSCG-928-N13]